MSKASSTLINLILINLILFGYFLAQENPKCRIGFCAVCDEELGCLKCIGSKRNDNNECTGTIPIDNCMVYNEADGYCEECEKGYALNEENQCIDSEITNCVKGSRLGDREICLVCEDDHMPTYNRSYCLDEHEIPECEWGYREGQLEGCALCDKGYSLYGYGCVRNCVEGCKKCEKRLSGPDKYIQVCTECDYHRKYWMTGEGVCTEKAGNLKFWITILAVMMYFWISIK